VCDSNGRKVDLGSPGAPLDCKPDLGRILCGQFVISEGRREAKYSLRYALCQLHIGLIFRDGRSTISVEATTDALNPS